MSELLSKVEDSQLGGMFRYILKLMFLFFSLGVNLQIVLIVSRDFRLDDYPNDRNR